MNTKGKISIKGSTARVSATTPIRLAGLSAAAAGLCFIVIGMFHPLNVPASVTTATWFYVHVFATALGFFGLFGMAGLYARQAEKSGWLGLAGFLLFTVWMTLVTGFSFVEAFIMPDLAVATPKFIEGWMGMFANVPSPVDLGLLPLLWNISGPMYILGPLLFGIATFRAGVLPRWAGGLLVIAALLVPVSGLVPPEHQAKLGMIPVGLALAGLGYSLWSERREKDLEPVAGLASPQVSQTGAD